MKQNAFIRVPVESLPTIKDALRTAGFEQAAADVEMFARDYTDPDANTYRQKWLERARDTVEKEGEIEFDNDATISHSDANGEYVLGWVWVEGDKNEDEHNEITELG